MYINTRYQIIAFNFALMGVSEKIDISATGVYILAIGNTLR